MQRILSIVSLMALVTITSLVAQDKLVVKAGKTFTYITSAQMDITQSMAGQEMSMTNSSEGTTVLKVMKLGNGTIDWTFAVPRIRTKMSNPMMGEMDTTLSVKPTPFSTTVQGEVTGGSSIADAMESIGGGTGAQKLTVGEFFSPTLSAILTPGTTWDKTTVDTTMNNGVEIHIARTIRYTFDGVVDTLKTRTVRVRAESTSMTLEGKGEVQAFNLEVNGDGRMHSISYYSIKDGMLVATSSETEIDARAVVSGAQNMIIPSTYKIASSMHRK